MSNRDHTGGQPTATRDDQRWEFILELPPDTAERTTTTGGFNSITAARAALVRVIVDLAADWVPLAEKPETEDAARDSIDVLSRAVAEIANASEPTEVIAGEYRFVIDRVDHQ